MISLHFLQIILQTHFSKKNANQTIAIKLIQVDQVYMVFGSCDYLDVTTSDKTQEYSQIP